jgi:Tfp pilus assembly protein PilO
MSKEQPSPNFLRRYPLALASVGVAFVLIAVVLVRGSGLTEARDQLELKQTEAQKAERNQRNAAGIEQHLDALNANVARLESMLVGVDDVSGNQGYFYRLESSTGVRVSVLRPTGVVKDYARGGVYQAAGFSVVVQGSYPQVVAFLRALENGGRLYRLIDFTLQRSSEQKASASTPEVALNLNLLLLARKQ